MTSDPFRQAFIFGTGELALSTARFCASRGLTCHVFIGPRQTSLTDANQTSYVDLLSDYTKDIVVTDILSDQYDRIRQTLIGRSFAFSFGSPFLIKKVLLDIFDQEFYNMHNTSLPEWRGGASYSWMILSGARKGATTIHRIDEGIDTGSIVAQSAYDFPLDCRLPRDYADHARRQAEPVLLKFLDDLLSGRPVLDQPQDESRATYFPRLHTETQSYIDWRWSGENIETFIRAFSHPYDGARTLSSGQIARIFDCRFESGEKSHPFANGIIIRSCGDEFVVCVSDGILRIQKQDCVCDKPLAVGDRFYTPDGYLEQALLSRPIYNPSGLKWTGA
ncbi:hypothetical protein GCM10007276_10800 [Agaricicola taiwanensis]|uniref:Methionyl-tRNA formyltransferase n=1 Tax=Agaricicola taiwanensis TaxID=591372 RepID=A0A8J2YGC8_9RHOB|nr:formyltransferase family protein [Agaricicola taiwanensis]GGE35139.1 hypothetical protein GCM10007276_10800 [Agaricicola taiwanensis]